MTYDRWKTTQPDEGTEPMPPATPEEERAAAWEYWHQRARRFEAALQDIVRIADDAADITNDGNPNAAMNILTIASQALWEKKI